MIGDLLYQLSAKDIGSLGLDLVRYKWTVSNTASVIAQNILVPNDRVWFLQRITFECTPGATQAVRGAEVLEGQNNGAGGLSEPKYYIAASAQPYMDSLGGYPAATLYRFEFEFDFMMIGSNKMIQPNVIFNAGVNANTVVCGVLGYSIPRGNIAF